jgi:hypothetical protein
MKKYLILIAAVLVIIAIGAIAYKIILFKAATAKPVLQNIPDVKTKSVQVFFANTKLNPNPSDCSAVFPVNRDLPTASNYAGLLIQLFMGPTGEETGLGYTSPFSRANADILAGLNTVGDTAYVNLKDIRTMFPNASASCGSQQFFSEVEKTLKQDGKIKNVIFAINGDPAPFYEWMQIGCTAQNNNCDPAPFATNPAQ